MLASAPRRTAARLVTLSGVALVLSLVLSALPASPATAARAPEPFTPTSGARFNNPLGSEWEKRQLFTYLIRTVNSVPSRGTIRFAVFSFADKATADALIAAHRRGVDVKLVFAGSNVYPPMQRLRRALGGNVNARSFATWCRDSCRGYAGQMHAKYFSFSEAGRADHVTMIGSNNLTRHNSHEQWSDLYTLANGPTFFRTFLGWFAQLKNDRPVARPFVRARVAGGNVVLTPMSPQQHGDPIMQALNRIICQTRKGVVMPDAPDPDTILRTRIMIAAHAWNGLRGRLLARKVAELARRRCVVWVYHGVGVGPYVREIVRKGGGYVTNGRHRGIYTHQKLMIVRGHIGAQAWTNRVWTGSHNWSPRAYDRDDILVEIAQQPVAAQYRAAFWRMWARG